MGSDGSVGAVGPMGTNGTNATLTISNVELFTSCRVHKANCTFTSTSACSVIFPNLQEVRV